MVIHVAAPVSVVRRNHLFAGSFRFFSLKALFCVIFPWDQAGLVKVVLPGGFRVIAWMVRSLCRFASSFFAEKNPLNHAESEKTT